MSRHRSTGSYGHRIKYERPDEYVITWRVDFYYVGQRGRYPRSFARDTNEKGARAFAKRHGVPLPQKGV